MYSPFDLVYMVINDIETNGRPIELDSEIVDYDTMENAFGYVVKPRKLSTMCPECGQGLIIEVKLPDPPFDPIIYNCEHCRPKSVQVKEPFCNPVEAGCVQPQELDPLLYAAGSITMESSPVGERIDAARLSEPSVDFPVDSGAGIDEDLIKALGGEESQTEKSEILADEFDDSDLAELE